MRITVWSFVAVLLVLPACSSTHGTTPSAGSGESPAVVERIKRPTIVEIRRGPAQTLVAVSLKLTDTSGVVVYSAAAAPIQPSDMHVLPPDNDGSGMDACALCQEFGPQLAQPTMWADWNGTECEAGPGQPCPCPPR